MAKVSIEQVHKSYGAVAVVHGVSVDIEDGEFVVLVGPSGCGKSTLLRMIAGLEDITGGRIVIGPHVVNDLLPKERDIAMVFQNYALYPHMTVAQNLGFSLMLKRAPKEESRERVERAAAILGLTDLLERYPKELSGGQRQRVAMGRAIVRNPKVFLFDEPLSNLDAKLRVQMRTEIKELHQRLKTTIVYVTHDQIEAMTMADRIVVMQDGVIEQVGTPLELYDTPANTFVGSFIGSPAMNMLEGVITGGSDPGVKIEETRIPVADLSPDMDGRHVTVGVRPENFVLDDAGIPAKIVVVEPTGAEMHVLADMGSTQVTVVFRERHAFQPGQEIRLTPVPGSAHLFDGETGKRI